MSRNSLLETIAIPETSGRNEIRNHNHLVHKRTLKGTVMEMEKPLIKVRSRVSRASEISHSNSYALVKFSRKATYFLTFPIAFLFVKNLFMTQYLKN